MFFYEIEGHIQILSSFGRVNKIQPKKSLKLDIQVPLQFHATRKLNIWSVSTKPPGLCNPLGWMLGFTFPLKLLVTVPVVKVIIFSSPSPKLV